VLDAMTRKWWVLLVRGVFGVLIGVLAFAGPGLSVLSIVLSWAVFTEADGIAALVLALTGYRSHRSRWPLTIAVAIVAGLLTLASPGLGLTLLMVVAVWTIGRGLFQIVAALELRGIIEREWLMILGGALSVVFGLTILAHPIFGVGTLAYLIGFYASAAGVLEIALSFGARRSSIEFEQRVSPRPSAV